MKPAPSAASQHLLALAQKAARIYTANSQAEAMMVAGSAASGEADYYSDLDLMVYYRELPGEEELEAARKANGGAERLWRSGQREEGAFAEAYMTGGVQQQIVHSTLQAWEKTINRVLLELDLTPTLQKALMGMQDGLALYGEAQIQAWKDRLRDYPSALAAKMVQHHLQFFPLWGYAGYFAGRDALIWHYQTLVEAAHNLLGVLAGLNRCTIRPSSSSGCASSWTRWRSDHPTCLSGWSRFLAPSGGKLAPSCANWYGRCWTWWKSTCRRWTRPGCGGGWTGRPSPGL